LFIVANEGSEQPGSGALRLRALAHPLRWKLLNLVGAERSATATRCAEVLGESVASCSYHLGILGKYGYIEPVPGVSGREKPWQQVTGRLVFADTDLDPEEQRALEAFADSFLDFQIDHIRTQLHRVDLEPPEWAQAGGMSAGTMYVTAGELHALKEELNALLVRYSDRDDDPGLRPATARPTSLFFSLFVEPPR
jgi:hypothetical protein